jgi:rare lipoprotein A
VAQAQPVSPAASAAKPKAPLAAQGSYLQVGAFDNPDSAQQLQKQVRGYTALPILVQQRNNMYKVWVGPIADKMELSLIRRILKKSANISGFMVKP